MLLFSFCSVVFSSALFLKVFDKDVVVSVAAGLRHSLAVNGQLSMWHYSVCMHAIYNLYVCMHICMYSI